MKKLIALFAIALFALAIVPATVFAAPVGQWPSGACTTGVSPNGCYGGYCGSYGYGGSYAGYYGYAQARGTAWSKWAPVRLKYHYPYSGGITQRYGDYNQWPVPYAHQY